MNKRLALELLQKVSNPSHMFTELETDEDGAVPNVPQRIASRHTARPRPKSPIPQLDSDGKKLDCNDIYFVFPININYIYYRSN